MENSNIAGCLSGSPLWNGMIFKNNKVARSILGKNIIFPQEITKACNLFYDNEQLQKLVGSFPSKETLYWCMANNYVLLPGPPTKKTLLEVCSLKPGLFYGACVSWCRTQEFAAKELADCGWLAIRKEPVPESTNKGWQDQLSLIGDQELVPNASMMGWFITTYWEVRHVRLFESIFVRTSSLTSGRGRVEVGGFNQDGLHIHYDADYHSHGFLGLAAARK